MPRKMIGLKVSDDLKQQLQELADREHRPLANFCLHAVIEYVKENCDIEIKFEDVLKEKKYQK